LTMASAEPPSKRLKSAEDILVNEVDRAGNSIADSKSGYFDRIKEWKVIMTQEEIDCAVQRCADRINTEFVGEKIVLCGVLKGAFIFMTDLVRKLTRPYSIYFLEAKSYEGQKQTGVRFLSTIVPEKFEGRKIILVDELVDNGHTLHRMKEHLMTELKRPAEDIVTCAVFAKEIPTRPAELNPEICGVDNLPNVWLVGYGLDDNGTKRGWRNLWACPKIPGIPKSAADGIFDGGAASEQQLLDIRETIKGAL